MESVLYVLMVQGLLGAIDTVYHHELTQALPRRTSARLELRLHGVRAVFYGFLFAALAWSRWHGLWFTVLAAVIVLEVVLTLWDFVEEDRSRQLPASERIMHTVLAINGGALCALLLLQGWWRLPTAIVAADHGWISVVLSLMALGVTLSGMRDALASLAPDVTENLASGPPRRWLLTGGSGFIGSHLVRVLLASGHAVTVLTRQPRALAVQYHGRVRAVACPSQLSDAEQFDVIVNLAGAPLMDWPWTRARRALLRSSRIDLTHRLLQWLQAHPQPGAVLISASAVGIYGRDPAGPCDEGSPAGDDFAATLCHDWEQAVWSTAQPGLRRVVLRLGLVLGCDGGVWPLLSLPVRLGLGARMGSGSQPFPWVHLHDVLRVILEAAQRPDWQGSMNVVAPQAVTQLQFVQRLARLCRRPQWLRLPAWLLRGLLGARADIVLLGQWVEPRRLSEAGFIFEYASLERALPHLLGRTSRGG